MQLNRVDKTALFDSQSCSFSQWTMKPDLNLSTSILWPGEDNRTTTTKKEYEHLNQALERSYSGLLILQTEKAAALGDGNIFPEPDS